MVNGKSAIDRADETMDNPRYLLELLLRVVNTGLAALAGCPEPQVGLKRRAREEGAPMVFGGRWTVRKLRGQEAPADPCDQQTETEKSRDRKSDRSQNECSARLILCGARSQLWWN